MPPVTGVGFVLQIENPASPGTYRTLGGQRETGMPRTVDEADFTSKDSAGWHDGAPVIRNWSMRASAILDEADAAYGDLETHFTNNTQPGVRILTPAANTYTGVASLMNLSVDGPHDDALTVTVELKGAGVLTKA